MVDLVLGRGITDLIREAPFFVSIFRKYISIKLFDPKPAMYGFSVPKYAAPKLPHLMALTSLHWNPQKN
ncbi:MAG: hypothetical protein ACJ704_11505, partial [Nitrososphaeraceae archaeon]